MIGSGGLSDGDTDIAWVIGQYTTRRSTVIDGVDIVDIVDGVVQAHSRPSPLTNYEL
jgi:hypothetical protein